MRFLAILSLALCWTKPVSGDGAEEIQYRHHFYDRVLGSSEPVLVEFLLNACKYCVTFRSVFDEVGAAFTANHSGFKYYKVRHVSALSFNIKAACQMVLRRRACQWPAKLRPERPRGCQGARDCQYH